jgi:hypothetical protein
LQNTQKSAVPPEKQDTPFPERDIQHTIEGFAGYAKARHADIAFGIECSKNPIPQDQNISIIVGAGSGADIVMHTMVGRRHEHKLENAYRLQP